MERVGNFRKELFPSSRVPSLDILYEGMQKHHIKALMEIDVSEARQSIKMWSEKHGEKLSFTAWVIFCIGQAAGKFPESHAARKGKNIIYFQDVDVSMIIERDVNGKLVPLPYVVRKANEKTVFQIHQ
jgi:pyruvate/2-oxoglutarate dehydrogenase complex dihydrolipoamide acyltransferase (E2) component